MYVKKYKIIKNFILTKAHKRNKYRIKRENELGSLIERESFSYNYKRKKLFWKKF